MEDSYRPYDNDTVATDLNLETGQSGSLDHVEENQLTVHNDSQRDRTTKLSSARGYNFRRETTYYPKRKKKQDKMEDILQVMATYQKQQTTLLRELSSVKKPALKLLEGSARQAVDDSQEEQDYDEIASGNCDGFSM